MKRFALVITCVLVTAVLQMNSFAFSQATDAITQAQKDAYGVTELEAVAPDEANAIWGNLTVADASHPQMLMTRLWEAVSGAMHELLRAALQNAAMILLICFILAVVQALPLDSGQAKVCTLAGAVSIALICTRETSACVPLGFRAIETLSMFSGKLLPALCAAAAAGGAFTSAGAKYAVSSLVLNLLISVSTGVLRPMLNVYIAAVVVGNVLQNEVLLSVTGVIKRLLRICLVGTAMAFTAYLALTGILNGSVDAAAAKAAKTAVSTALPVVGSILSDAADTVVSGAGILRAAIGSFGLICAVAVCWTPYAVLGIRCLIYKLISGLSSSFSDKRITALLNGFSDIYAMLLATVGTVSYVLFASVVSLMRGVNA